MVIIIVKYVFGFVEVLLLVWIRVGRGGWVREVNFDRDSKGVKCEEERLEIVSCVLGIYSVVEVSWVF